MVASCVVILKSDTQEKDHETELTWKGFFIGEKVKGKAGKEEGRLASGNRSSREKREWEGEPTER